MEQLLSLELQPQDEPAASPHQQASWHSCEALRKDLAYDSGYEGDDEDMVYCDQDITRVLAYASYVPARVTNSN